MKLANLNGPHDVMALLLRRKWCVILCFIGLSAGVLLFTKMLPPMYVSEGIILVRPRGVPSDFVKDLITVTPAERLSIITAQIMSAPNLESTLKKFGGEIPGLAHLNPQEQILKLRKQIDVQFSAREDLQPGQAPRTTFQISGKNHDPVVAQKLVKELVEGFLTQDQANRASNVNETARFFQSRVDQLNEDLVAADANIKEVQTRRRNELPSQRDSNLRRIENLNVMNVAEATSRTKFVLSRDQYEQELALTPREIPKPARPQSKAPPDPAVVAYRAAAEELKALKRGRGDGHPDVERATVRLDAIDRELTDAQWEEAQKPVAVVGSDVEEMQPNPAYAGLQRLIAASTKEIEAIDERIARNEEVIKALSRHVDGTPQTEQELRGALREYDTLTRHHQEMTSKLDAVKLSEIAEDEQRGSNFQVLEWPNLPLTPSRPFKASILSAGLTLSLLIALALAFLVDIASQKTWTQSDVTYLVGAKVLVEVPRIATSEGLAQAQKRRASFATSIGVAGIAYAFLLFLVYTNPGFVLQTLDPLIQKFY